MAIGVVAAAAAALTLPAEAAPDRRVALVIGNAAYREVPALANPTKDARAMSATLKRLGFEVVEGYDLKNDGMRTTIGEFAAKLDGAKVALVYFAGHGIAVGDENYLLPTDAILKSESDLDFRTVNVNLVLRQMQREERVSILILDACRDNPFARELARSIASSNANGRTRSSHISAGLSAIDSQSTSGILIAFATDPRATALDGGAGGNSPFTAALLKHMESPGVPISTVMDRVREDVWNATGKRQKPWVNTSIIGEFMLNPIEPKVAALTASGSSTSDVAKSATGSALDRAQMDLKTWESAEKADTAEDYQAYLDIFPTGQFAKFAKLRIARLKAAASGTVTALPARNEKEVVPTRPEKEVVPTRPEKEVAPARPQKLAKRIEKSVPETKPRVRSVVSEPAPRKVTQPARRAAPRAVAEERSAPQRRAAADQGGGGLGGIGLGLGMMRGIGIGGLRIGF